MDSGWSEKCLLFPIGFPKGLRQIRAVRGMGNPRLSARCRVVLAEGLPSRPPKSALGSRDCVVPRTRWTPDARGGTAQGGTAQSSL